MEIIETPRKYFDEITDGECLGEFVVFDADANTDFVVYVTVYFDEEIDDGDYWTPPSYERTKEKVEIGYIHQFKHETDELLAVNKEINPMIKEEIKELIFNKIFC
jgi:hypothetical protein